MYVLTEQELSNGEIRFPVESERRKEPCSESLSNWAKKIERPDFPNILQDFVRKGILKGIPEGQPEGTAVTGIS